MFLLLFVLVYYEIRFRQWHKYCGTYNFQLVANMRQPPPSYFYSITNALLIYYLKLFSPFHPKKNWT